MCQQYNGLSDSVRGVLLFLNLFACTEIWYMDGIGNTMEQISGISLIVIC